MYASFVVDSIAKEPYIFVILQGGSGLPVPPLDLRMNIIMSLVVVRKPVFQVCDQIILQPPKETA